jgi:hypothetical protein
MLHDIQGKVFAKISLDNLSSFPLPYLERKSVEFLGNKADVMLAKKKELQQCKRGLLKLLQAKQAGLTITNKLADWPSLTFGAFLKELEKQKLKWSLPEQSEWMPYFESEQQKAVALQQVIAQTDAEIDALVYRLYGLTDDEIRIVESQ